MRRYLSRFAIPLLTLAVTGAPGLAFGQGAWFVVADPTYNCNIVNHPAGRWEQQIGGPYATVAEATKAMFRATVCLQGPIAQSQREWSWYYSFGQFADEIPHGPLYRALHR